MPFIRIAYDAPNKDAERKSLYEAHRAHLRSGLTPIGQSGPMFASDAEGRKAGGLVVFDTDDLADIERFNARDPYVINGVYDRIEILRWNKTIG